MSTRKATSKHPYSDCARWQEMAAEGEPIELSAEARVILAKLQAWIADDTVSEVDFFRRLMRLHPFMNRLPRRDLEQLMCIVGDRLVKSTDGEMKLVAIVFVDTDA